MDLCIIVRKAVLTVRVCSVFSCSTAVKFTDVLVRVSARELSQSLEELNLSQTCQHRAPSFISVKTVWFFSAAAMLWTPPGCLSGRKFSFHLSGNINLWFFLPELLLHVLHNPCLCKNPDSMKHTQFFFPIFWNLFLRLIRGQLFPHRDCLSASQIMLKPVKHQ